MQYWLGDGHIVYLIDDSNNCYIYSHCANTLFNLKKRIVYVLPFKVMEFLIFILYKTCLVNTYVYYTMLY